MKIYLKDILQLDTTLDKISNEELPIKTVFKLKQIQDKIQESVKFYSDNISSIIKLYSKKDENGNPIITENQMGIKIEDDKIEECQQKLEELENCELILDDDLLISIEELADIKCSLNELRGLNPILKKEEA